MRVLFSALRIVTLVDVEDVEMLDLRFALGGSLSISVLVLIFTQ